MIKKTKILEKNLKNMKARALQQNGRFKQYTDLFRSKK